MPRTIESEPLQKHILRLYEGDFDKLTSYYPEVTATVVIRKLVRRHITELNKTVGNRLPEEGTSL